MSAPESQDGAVTGEGVRWAAEFVATFHLRGRASRAEYLAGRALAESDAVRLVTLDPGTAIALVTDGVTYRVVLREANGAIDTTCTCHAVRGVCRHAVAVEHALWLRFAS